MLLADVQQAAGVLDYRPHLQAVADNASVTHQPRLVFVAIGRNAVQIKALEGTLIPVLLFKDRLPGQPCLPNLQCQALQKGAVAADRKAVLGVMVLLVDRARQRILAVGKRRGRRRVHKMQFTRFLLAPVKAVRRKAAPDKFIGIFFK